MEQILITSIWLPLLGFIINSFLATRQATSFTILLATIFGIFSVVLPFLGFVFLTFNTNSIIHASGGLHAVFFEWIKVANLNINFAYQLDSLSLFMAWIITGIGSLIHIYSVGYMAHEKNDFARFFAYLNLFIFAMLHLVLGDNIVITFLGWEGVGLCSYLLIAFDRHKISAAEAGNKAFIVNRIGDAGFLIGIFLLFYTVGSLDYTAIIYYFQDTNVSLYLINLICIFLFIGAMGKSAQLPLYVWLPDAMAGPTPVSALIHAATMVTAGIFIICKLSVLFAFAQYVSIFISFVGAITAITGAIIALTQTDIKKILAYSTMSQLGYMFVAVGVGAYGAGMFHLMTHAFFKALLFLSSGAVIIALHHEQDIRKMGKLAGSIPYITIVFWIGALALSGMPAFSGFFSKDMILEEAFTFSRGGVLLYSVGLITALLTSFYVFRLMFITFHSKSFRFTHKVEHVSLFIKAPLFILAILSIVGGYVGLPHLFTHTDSPIIKYFSQIIPPSVTHIVHEHHKEIDSNIALILMLLSIIVVFIGLAFAWYRYQYQGHIPKEDNEPRTQWVNFSFNKLYVDELYNLLFVVPLKRFSTFLYNKIDLKWINGIFNGFADLCLYLGDLIKRCDNGQTSQYALYIFGAVVFILLFFIV